MKKCELCEYALRASHDDAFETNVDAPTLYECRRYPPQVVWHGHENDWSTSDYFPFVKANDWCGEYVGAKQETLFKAVEKGKKK